MLAFSAVLRTQHPCDMRNPCSPPAHPHPCASVLSVGATICSLILILPQMPRIITDLYIPHPCASVLSVGATICSLVFILPQMPRIIRFIYPTSVLIRAICGSHHLQLDIVLPQMPLTDFFFWIMDFSDFTEAAPL